MTKNPLTFRHITDGVPLPATPRALAAQSAQPRTPRCTTPARSGRSMLWECYSNLLNDTARLTFAQAQDRMKRYLVGGYKMTPTDPTFVSARDALLAVMQAQDPQDHDLCLHGFAKRGARRGRRRARQLLRGQRGRRRELQGGDRPAAAQARRRSSTTTPAFDHYFITDIADEITKLDNGTFVGWARTGESFNVYADVPRRQLPPCAASSARRSAPKSSHFYTPDVERVRDGQAEPELAVRGRSCSTCRAPDAGGQLPGGHAAGLPAVQQRPGRRAQPPLHDEPRPRARRCSAKGWIPEGYGASASSCARRSESADEIRQRAVASATTHAVKVRLSRSPYIASCGPVRASSSEERTMQLSKVTYALVAAGIIGGVATFYNQVDTSPVSDAAAAARRPPRDAGRRADRRRQPSRLHRAGRSHRRRRRQHQRRARARARRRRRRRPRRGQPVLRILQALRRRARTGPACGRTADRRRAWARASS